MHVLGASTIHAYIISLITHTSTGICSSYVLIE